MTRTGRRQMVAARHALDEHRVLCAEVDQWAVMSDDAPTPKSEWEVGELIAALMNSREQIDGNVVFVALNKVDVAGLTVQHPIRATRPALHSGTGLAGRTVLASPIVPAAPPTQPLAYFRYFREGPVWIRGSREDALAA